MTYEQKHVRSVTFHEPSHTLRFADGETPGVGSVVYIPEIKDYRVIYYVLCEVCFLCPLTFMQYQSIQWRRFKSWLGLTA